MKSQPILIFLNIGYAKFFGKTACNSIIRSHD